MRNLIKSVALAALMASTAAPAMAGEWYSGGNLGRANLGQWASATPANRLATSADSVTVLRKHLGKPMAHPDSYKNEARQLVICMREVAIDPALWPMKVSEVTHACMVAMNWL